MMKIGAFEVLNSKAKKEVFDVLRSEFGFEKELDYVFLRNNKGKIYIASPEIGQIDFKKLRIDSFGIYFGRMIDGQIRLSIEGSQLIGPYCNRNIIELNEKQTRLLFQGYDFEYKAEDGFYILKYEKEFIGCCKIKNNKLHNYIPKARRVEFI